MRKRQKSLFYQKIDFYIIFSNLSFIDGCNELRSYERGVAQLGSAGALGALGRRFESCRPDHLKTKSYKRVSQTLFFYAYVSN